VNDDQTTDEMPLTGSTPSSGNDAPMRLRAEPPRVTRLSRKVLAGLGIIAGAGVGGALIFALQGRVDNAAPAELFSTENRTPADGLQRLPRDYSGVPLLGPPLPGDLGRPIVSAREHGQSVPLTGLQPAPGVSAEEQHRLQELDAARISWLFASSNTQTSASAPDAIPAAVTNAIPNLESLGLAPQPATPIAQDRQLAFINAPVDRRTVTSDRITAPPSPYVVQAGAVIPAALITGIRSDLPGQITAQVTENVYDSPTGRLLLIPQGTRLIGEYDNGVGFGQRRVLLVWNRLIFPNGKSIILERQPGADSQGYAGLEDGVDYHWRDLARAATLSTLLGVGAELATGDSDRLVSALRNGAQDTINDAGQQIVRRQLSIQPTLTIRPGFPVRVIVTRDLVLEPYQG
jgi:type IV secretion system protein VirB10